MIDIVLLEPEIPPNTGNIIRLCANTGFHLHLIEPLGFEMDEPRLRRAGLDYHEWARVQIHDTLDAYLAQCRTDRVFAFTTKAQRTIDAVGFAAGDALLFGPETRGLSTRLLETFAEDRRVRIPMRKEARSLNLSNAVAVAAYEAWRQLGFKGSSSSQTPYVPPPAP